MSTYINHRAVSAAPEGGFHGFDAVNWYDFTHKRLMWLYGPERALQIHKGNDQATNADLDRWNSLGRSCGVMRGNVDNFWRSAEVAPRTAPCWRLC